MKMPKSTTTAGVSDDLIFHVSYLEQNDQMIGTTWDEVLAFPAEQLV
jgi:hypothetical protein